MPEYTWFQLTNAASGVLFIALGALVGWYGRAHPAPRAFAVFAAAYGTGMVTLNLGASGAFAVSNRPATDTPWLFLSGALLLAAAYGILQLALRFPRPLTSPERRTGLLVGLLVLAFLVANAIGFAGLGVTALEIPPGLAWLILISGLWGTSALLALRFPHLEPRHAYGTATLAAALALVPTFYFAISFGGLFLAASHPRDTLVPAAALLGPPLILAGLWLTRMPQLDLVRARHARNVAWTILLAALFAASAAGAADDQNDHWGYGAVRTLSVLLIAFAIARGHMPGIDLKVRFTVSKTTLAATFVTVFFIASEAAQQFMGETLGSTYFGIAAAGALVFVLAPLQRAAERLAAKAVPSSTPEPAPTMSPIRPTDAYLAAVRAALDDGAMTDAEERHLAEVAEHLGLRPTEALRLRKQARRNASETA